MSAVTRPLGPLPPRVYWTRRLLLLAVLLALVFGVARLLGGGGGGNGPSAQPVAAGASSTPASSSTSATSPPAPVGTAATVTSSPTASASPSPSAGKRASQSPTSTALPEPSGPCSVDDIVITPTIKDQAHAGKPVTFAMQLTTKSTPACTFDVAADSLVVKITSGSDRVWSTQDCPKAVPTKSLVVRKDTPTTVDVSWSAMRSDSDCSKTTRWAETGYYHALAAVFGAEPVDEQFELLKPVRPTVTAKPSPDSKSQDKSGDKKSTKQPSKKPSSKPSKKSG